MSFVRMATKSTASKDSDSSRSSSADVVTFIREFVKAPMLTAAVMPSSSFLAAQMVAPIPEKGAPVVVELGPGTGAFSGPIQQRLRGRGRHIALELNPRLADLLRLRYPQIDVVCANARDLPGILSERGLSADVVVSGLPWAAYSPTGGSTLVQLIGESLSKDGAFTQFSYVWTRWALPARRQLSELRSTFEETIISRTVWRNVPPALVYVARRPRRSVSAHENKPDHG